MDAHQIVTSLLASVCGEEELGHGRAGTGIYPMYFLIVLVFHHENIFMYHIFN